jgi:hypothetical protein
MHTFTVDRAKDRPDPRVLLHRSYYANGVPRIMAVCRLLGHKPVVDGYDSNYGPGTEQRARWVACDRCGVRPEPQGSLDPDQWQLGQPYTGPVSTARRLSATVVKQLARKGITPATSGQPGPWPAQPTGDLGAELVIGRSTSLGIGVTIGTEGFGKWVQRRLNPAGYHDRQIGLDVHNGRLWWKVWARENESRSTDPKWMEGNAPIDPRHYLFGPRRNRKISETDRVPATVYMPEGDTHQVTVHLQQWETRRTRGRATTYWMAQWDCQAGIPVRNHDWKGDETFSCAWMIEGVTPDNPRWPYILAAKAAEQCTRDRARYGYRAPEAA